MARILLLPLLLISSFISPPFALSFVVPSFAFSLNRLRRETHYFSAEERLPPLDKIYSSSSSPTRMVGGGSNSTTTMTIPYSSPTTTTTSSSSSDKPLPVLYTNDPKLVNRWLVDHVPMEGCVLGFDTESVPDAPWITSRFKGRPVTVQLATPHASLVIPLVRNNRYTKACFPLIEAVLSDENIIKCGCSIDDDMMDLKRMVPGLESLDARSRFDVGLLGTSKNRLGLKALTRILLNLELEKPKRIAVSNWSRFPLSDEQLNYAARDAWAGSAVLEELVWRYPETFGTDVLIERLKLQPSLDELCTSKQRKQKAKFLLSRFQTPYQKKTESMPSNVAEKVTQLKAVLKETYVDHSDVESLGFIPHESGDLRP